jgi:hypothetical protein
MLVLGVAFDCSRPHAPSLAVSPCIEIAAMSLNTAHFYSPGWGTCVPDTPVSVMIPTRSPATGFAMSARRLTYALFAEQSDIAPQFEQISLRQQPNF